MCLLRAPGGRGAAPCARGVLRTSAVWGGNAAIWGFFQISGGEEAVSARTAGSETRTWKREHLARGITRTQPERGIFKASSQGAGRGRAGCPPPRAGAARGHPKWVRRGRGGARAHRSPQGALLVPSSLAGRLLSARCPRHGSRLHHITGSAGAAGSGLRTPCTPGSARGVLQRFASAPPCSPLTVIRT